MRLNRPSAMARKEWKDREFKGILMGGTVYQAASSMQGTVVSPFLNNRGFSPGQIGLLNSVSWGIIGFASMPCGRLSDIIGRRAPLILSSFLGMVACMLVYFLTNPFTAIFLYGLIGFSVAFFTPNTGALIFESVESSKAPVFFAVFYLATLIGASFSSFASGWFSNVFMIDLPFLVASILFLASIPFYFFYIRKGGGMSRVNGLRVLTHSVNVKAMLSMLKQNPRLGFYGFSLLFHELGFYMMNPYITLFAQKIVGLDMAGVGMVVAIWNVGSAVGFLPWAWVTTSRGSGKMLLIHLLISSPAWALIALSNSLASMLIYMFLFGLVGAMDLPARRTLTAELCQGENLGEAMGFLELSNGLSGMLGGAIGGFFWEAFGPNSIFYLASVLTLVSTPLLLLVIRKR